MLIPYQIFNDSIRVKIYFIANWIRIVDGMSIT